MNSLNTTVYPSSYECTITVDCSVFGFQDNELKLLLVKRSIEPYKDHWLLPGGIMGEGQTVEEAVNRVLFNLTGIHGIHQEQVGCYSAVDRHPVKRAVTVNFYALIKPENHPAIPNDYVSDVQWFSLNNLPQKLGFDHEILAKDALAKLKRNLQDNLIFGELLPEKFTLKEMQDLYESILDEKLDRRNFRKKILQMNLLEKTNEKKAGVKGGPDLFRIK
ncbi:NUDIX hydrolase [Fulvivirga ligni]|uniref:NUDIX hydrolase n=1 Tax=Fulvivirga ligni TaxID=2904246 RepID=UPI001F2BB477|nr:NUDIX domain-containing protein [Fulvivirga ligni]UII23166.1 NUDIX hydrolase [Fulvivirga ligni]